MVEYISNVKSRWIKRLRSGLRRLTEVSRVGWWSSSSKKIQVLSKDDDGDNDNIKNQPQSPDDSKEYPLTITTLKSFDISWGQYIKLQKSILEDYKIEDVSERIKMLESIQGIWNSTGFNLINVLNQSAGKLQALITITANLTS